MKELLLSLFLIAAVAGCSPAPKAPVAIAPAAPAPQPHPKKKLPPIIVPAPYAPPLPPFVPSRDVMTPPPRSAAPATSQSQRQPRSRPRKNPMPPTQIAQPNIQPTAPRYAQPRPVPQKRPFQDIKNEVDFLADQIQTSRNPYELRRLAAECSELADQVTSRSDVISIRPPRTSINALISAYRTLADAAQSKSYFVNNRYLSIEQQTKEKTTNARNAVLAAMADVAAAPVQ